ncbi:M10 family metallopeptidase C-terminal domain-containing protein [Cypionkella sinensis]|uniref:M10 family metallopeptidase C-terminal domain-containing protein n=1 Tax=Cypionkella sinensis TaxID=1756043 RepID=A0ABV7IWE5_9RHOB
MSAASQPQQSVRDLMANDMSIQALPLPGGDVADNTATTARLTLGTSTYGTIGASGDHDWYAVTLVAGQTYDFRVLGVGRAPVADTLLTLRNASGTQLLSNDDAGGALSLNSALTFTATTTGTYFLDVAGYSSSRGDFVVSAVNDTPAGVVLTADEVAWQLTNNFERFFGSGVSQNVPATAYDLSGGRTITYNVSQLTSAGATLAVQALRMWADVSGINFVATNGAAQITFDDSEAGVNAYNNNVTSPDGTITSSSMMITTGWLSEFGTSFDSYSFETTIHELGHALGLGHGGNYNGSATYGVDNFYLNDSQHLSIMSYMQSMHDEFSRDGTDYNTFVNAQFRWVLTPMIADILAISNLYGLSTTTRTGNTTYGYHSNTGNAALDQAVTLNDPANDNYVAFTIFDNGGTDTVDMSGFAGAQRIDLRQGASSDVLGGRLNMGIAYGTLVEQAFGGGGNDTIVGNASNNLLRGNNGNDSLVGDTGNDTLEGGAGVDTLSGGVGRDVMTGGAGNDIYIVDDATDQINEIGGGGTGDRVAVSVSFSLALDDDIEVLNTVGATGTQALNLSGNNMAQSITGNAGSNILSGLGGNDRLFGLGGNDQLDGGVGNDTLAGGVGSDWYFVDTQQDRINENAGEGAADRVWAATSYVLEADDDIETLSTSNGGLPTAINLTGNGLAQMIIGNRGANQLSGLGGNDTLNGGDGADTLNGGTGNDVLFGGQGRDVMTGGDGFDVFVFNAALIPANVDTVTGYVVAQDRIELDDAVFGALSVGALSSVNFAANTTGRAVRASDRIIYETDTGHLYYDADGVGGAAGILFANVGANLAGFGAGEFSII